jgi:hypothetical protein
MFQDFYCYQAMDAQAWTDLVSNVTALTPLTADDDPRPWLGWGNATSDQMSVFLHEAAHHWCFTSPVAYAIAGLTLRARVNLLRAQEERPSELEAGVVNDLLRAETAVALLRPFAEGLAMFAEFDATSRLESKAISPVLESLFQFFIRPQTAATFFRQLPGEAAIAACVGTVLHDLRTAPATLDRKASLLLKPFRASAGGYLPGYLAVKSLWRASLSKYFKLANETDTFLMYLRSYLYDDWSFVDVLLSDELDELRSGEALVNHLSGRLEQWNALRQSDFVDYEECLAAGYSPAKGPLPGLQSNPTAVERGRDRLRVLGLELADKRVDESMSATVSSWNASVLGRRQFMNLVSAAVEINTTGEGTALVRWNDIDVLPLGPEDLLAAAGEASGAAQMEVVVELGGDRFERAVVLHREGKVLACCPIGLSQHAAETRRNVKQAFVSRTLMTGVEEKMRDILHLMAAQSWVQIPLDHCRKQVDGILDEFLKDIALRFARDYDAVDGCAALMAEQGFKPVLERASRVRGLALLGLATSINPDTAAVSAVFEKHSLSLEQTLNELTDSYEQHGYPPPVLRAADSLFTIV